MLCCFFFKQKGGELRFNLTVGGFLGLLGPYSGRLWHWKPVLSVENDLVKIAACEYCAGTCYGNSICDFRNGQCRCSPGFDGPRCAIPCPIAPASCLDANIGVECRTDGLGNHCKCDDGKKKI